MSEYCLVFLETPLLPPYTNLKLCLMYLCSQEPTNVNQMVIIILFFQLRSPYLWRVRTFKFGFQKKVFLIIKSVQKISHVQCALGLSVFDQSVHKGVVALWPGGIQTFLYNSISNQLLSLAAKRRVLVSRSASQPNIVDVIIWIFGRNLATCACLRWLWGEYRLWEDRNVMVDKYKFCGGKKQFSRKSCLLRENEKYEVCTWYL